MPSDKEKGTKKGISLLIAVLMAGSILGIVVYNLEDREEEAPENSFEYEGYTFYETQEGFFGVYATIDGKETPVLFRADPRNLSEIYVTSDVVSRLKEAKKVYLAFNPNRPEMDKIGVAAYQLSRVLGFLHIPTVGAYSEDSDPVDPDVPVKNCTDSTKLTPVVMLELGPKTQITSGDCIYVRGETHEDLILAADKLGMHLIGITV